MKDQGEALASLLQIVELPKIPTVTEVVTGLTALPVIPGELKDRLKFTFDGNSSTDGNLTLTGWLTKAEKNTVSDANLTAAVVSLQAKALLKIPAPPPETLLDAENLSHAPELARRFRTIGRRLFSHLWVDRWVGQLSG